MSLGEMTPGQTAEVTGDHAGSSAYQAKLLALGLTRGALLSAHDRPRDALDRHGRRGTGGDVRWLLAHRPLAQGALAVTEVF